MFFRLLAASVLAPVLLSSGLLVTRVTAAPGYAGRWHVSYYQRCANTPRNDAACHALWGDEEPVFGISHTTWVYQEDDDLVYDGHGSFQVHGVATLTESVPHLGPLCDERIMYLHRGFNGRCRMVYTETWYVKQGKTGLPDFWVTCGRADSFAFVVNGRVKPEKRVCNIVTVAKADTLYPAQPRRWSVRQFGALFGLKQIPAGVQARLTVTHQR